REGNQEIIQQQILIESKKGGLVPPEFINPDVRRFVKGGGMILGIILICAGILIALYPPLLSLIVALTFIFAGIFFIYLGYYYKKVSRRFHDPFIDFFFRT
ncbi:MAG: hypothetical protein JSW40_03560, partial [Candidatus Omnitrophota bacterium]